MGVSYLLPLPLSSVETMELWHDLTESSSYFCLCEYTQIRWSSIESSRTQEIPFWPQRYGTEKHLML